MFYLETFFDPFVFKLHFSSIIFFFAIPEVSESAEPCLRERVSEREREGECLAGLMSRETGAVRDGR